MSDLPRITIITPSFDHPDLLEQTMLSVLDQDYPNLEYMVVDGSSTDECKQIIAQYDNRLHWWCHQRIENQAQAINKGLDKSTGDIIGWLNVGDQYHPGALSKVGQFFCDRPQTDFLYGICQLINQQGETYKQHRANLFKLEELLDLWNVWWEERNFIQPECFWSRRLFLKVRSFREDLDRAFVYEYWTRLFLAGAKVERLEEVLCSHRLSAGQYSMYSDATALEELAVIEPILWNPRASLDRTIRLRLQADWLYQTHLADTIADSAAAGDDIWQCRFKLAKPLCLHPKALLSERLQHRLQEFKQGTQRRDDT